MLILIIITDLNPIFLVNYHENLILVLKVMIL